jgi:hypothetical protein
MHEIAQPIRLIGSFSGNVAKQASAAMLAMSHWIQQRFSAFADVPYENPLTRQEWEDIWESDPQWGPDDGGPDQD